MNNNEWNDGLPPVGEIVECYWFNEWHLVEVTAIGRIQILFVLMKCGTEYSQYINDSQFRPIKSQADIERSSLVYALAEIIESNEDISMRQSTAHSIANDILDKGYRLQIPTETIARVVVCLRDYRATIRVQVGPLQLRRNKIAEIDALIKELTE